VKTGCRHFLLLLGLCVTTAMLADTGSDYSGAQAYIANQHFSDHMKTSVLNAHTLLPPAPVHPNQEKYYNHPESISTDAVSNIAVASSVGSLVRNDALTRPKITVNQASPEVIFSKKVQDNAKGISQGTYKDCKEKVITDDAMIQKTCSTSLPFNFDCIQALTVNVKEQWIAHHGMVSFPKALRITGLLQASHTMEVSQGEVTSITVTVSNKTNPFYCLSSYGVSINGVFLGWYKGQCEQSNRTLTFNVKPVKLPFNQTSMVVSLKGVGFIGYASANVSIDYQEKRKDIVKSWRSSCASIPVNCNIHHTQCVEPGGTKRFDGISVSATCWKKDETVHCGSTLSQTCSALEKEGCTQVSSRCEKRDTDICQLYELTWSCPTKKRVGAGIQCGQRFYCTDGSCQATTHEKNKDFGKSVTELSATVSAAGDVKGQGTDPHKDPNSIRIFTGHDAHCREIILGALNCCADRGWAKGIFANCNAEEKRLGYAKEQGGLVIYTGRYCTAHVLGACTEHKRSYCIFPSRIAYDVQIGGRYRQLRRGFGDGQFPDCSGLLPSEIGKINFDQVGFSNVINSVVGKATLPDGRQSQSSIEQQIRKRVAREQRND
jgi:conjugal transfer mating pair stabilization protein TraN